MNRGVLPAHVYTYKHDDVSNLFILMCEMFCLPNTLHPSTYNDALTLTLLSYDDAHALE